MSLLSYLELVSLVGQGVIDAPIENINSSSIDLTLDRFVMYELDGDRDVVDLASKQNIAMSQFDLDIDDMVLFPGDFILASSAEVFNLPNNISAEYKLKSSMARNGLEHLNAGWCDAGWNGSKLTLELKNMTQNHRLCLTKGMKIGQVVFFRHEPVPVDKSYAARGQYNGQQGVTASKGIR
jgi:dCTP deaminase